MFTTKNRSLIRRLTGPMKRFPAAVRILKQAGTALWRIEVRMRSRKWSEIPDVHKLYWVSPQRIHYALLRNDYDKWGERGTVADGDWDRRRIPFSELPVYQAFDQHFKHAVPWETSHFYQRVLGEIRSGKVKWGCRSKEDFDRRLHSIDLLYQDINVNGYKTQLEIKSAHDLPYGGEDEISVSVDRDGVLLFEDGRHRLAIAQLLNLEKVPIKITLRHARWYLFISEVEDYARKHGGKVYQPIEHPDLRHIPSVYDHDRFDMIAEQIGDTKGDLLDIGAHWGYFCRRFEQMGFKCFAIENSARHLYFLSILRKAERMDFAVVDRSIFDYKLATRYDAVLSLNIFHHFLKKEDSFYNFVGFLRRLNTRQMFFQAHNPESPQMAGAYKNFAPADFVQFILDNSNLNRATLLGRTQDGRPLYQLNE